MDYALAGLESAQTAANPAERGTAERISAESILGDVDGRIRPRNEAKRPADPDSPTSSAGT